MSQKMQKHKKCAKCAKKQQNCVKMRKIVQKIVWKSKKSTDDVPRVPRFFHLCIMCTFLVQYITCTLLVHYLYNTLPVLSLYLASTIHYLHINCTLLVQYIIGTLLVPYLFNTLPANIAKLSLYIFLLGPTVCHLKWNYEYFLIRSKYFAVLPMQTGLIWSIFTLCDTVQMLHFSPIT